MALGGVGVVVLTFLGLALCHALPAPDLLQLGLGVSDDSDGEVACCEGCCQTLSNPAGRVRGRQHQFYSIDGTPVVINRYKGIPFAEPPLGALRYQPAMPLQKPWKGRMDAGEYGPGCPITSCMLPEPGCALETAEDCLTLNVYLPLEEYQAIGDDGGPKKIPVVVYIHGGAYDQGSASSAVLDASHIAAEGVVAVTMNYRLGALGFLAADAAATVNGTLQGNYGITDQRMAMQWVKDNIAIFHGDPDKITVVGQSAGANSILLHLISQQQPLFHRAILQSPYFLPMRTRVSGASYVTAREFAESGNCLQREAIPAQDPSDSDRLIEQINVGCLQSMTEEQIVNAQRISQKSVFDMKNMQSSLSAWETPSINGKPLGPAKFHPYALAAFLPFGPVVDGTSVLDQILPMMQSGKNWVTQLNMPVIIGTTRDEGCIYSHALFAPGFMGPEYQYFLAMIFSTVSGETVDRINKNERYKPDVEYLKVGNLDKLSNLITDLMFRCPVANITRGAMWKPSEKTYVYMFNNSLHLAEEDKEEWGAIESMCDGLAPHGADVPAVFNAFSAQDKAHKEFSWHVTDQEKKLFHDMLSYWTNFAKSETGDPNGPDLPLWTPSMSDSFLKRLVLQTDGDKGEGSTGAASVDKGASSMENEPIDGCDIFNDAGYYW